MTKATFTSTKEARSAGATFTPQPWPSRSAGKAGSTP
jgi:hypothetical protein